MLSIRTLVQRSQAQLMNAPVVCGQSAKLGLEAFSHVSGGVLTLDCPGQTRACLLLPAAARITSKENKGKATLEY